MDSNKIYQNVARAIENDIISGKLREGDQVPSTHQVAEAHNINPATAARGVALLTSAGYLDKKRGIGLFIAEGTRDAIVERRRKDFRENYLQTAIAEAAMLGISKRDLIAMVMSVH